MRQRHTLNKNRKPLKEDLVGPHESHYNNNPEQFITEGWASSPLPHPIFRHGVKGEARERERERLSCRHYDFQNDNTTIKAVASIYPFSNLQIDTRTSLFGSFRKQTIFQATAAPLSKNLIKYSRCGPTLFKCLPPHRVNTAPEMLRGERELERPTPPVWTPSNLPGATANYYYHQKCNYSHTIICKIVGNTTAIIKSYKLINIDY